MTDTDGGDMPSTLEKHVVPALEAVAKLYNASIVPITELSDHVGPAFAIEKAGPQWREHDDRCRIWVKRPGEIGIDLAFGDDFDFFGVMCHRLDAVLKALILAQRLFRLRDGEVLGTEANGDLIQWNADDRTAYVSGQDIEDFGVENLNPAERIRCGLHPFV